MVTSLQHCVLMLSCIVLDDVDYMQALICMASFDHMISAAYATPRQQLVTCFVCMLSA